MAALLALALTGCTDAGEDVGKTAYAVTFPNDQPAFDYFLGKGLTPFQAAGIVGNLDQESGVDPTAVQSGGPGRGSAQWSVGGRWDTDANDNATWYAGTQGQSVWSLQLQLDFIWYELTTFPAYGLTALRQATNITDRVGRGGRRVKRSGRRCRHPVHRRHDRCDRGVLGHRRLRGARQPRVDAWVLSRPCQHRVLHYGDATEPGCGRAAPSGRGRQPRGRRGF